jgi:hypothetical protein
MDQQLCRRGQSEVLISLSLFDISPAVSPFTSPCNVRMANTDTLFCFSSTYFSAASTQVLTSVHLELKRTAKKPVRFAHFVCRSHSFAGASLFVLAQLSNGEFFFSGFCAKRQQLRLGDSEMSG